MSSILAKPSFLVNPRSTKILVPAGMSLIATIPKPLPGTASIIQSYLSIENCIILFWKFLINLYYFSKYDLQNISLQTIYETNQKL